MTDRAIAPDDIRKAAVRLAPHARLTPVVESTTINLITGARVFCKAEMLQRTGSFKFRGAMNAVESLTPDQRKAGVLTYSSGNHGQAISRAAGLLDVSATVVMPADAPAIKRQATENWGARVVEYDRYTESREAVTEAIRVETGAVVIPPYDHPDVMAGQGTTALELLDQVPDLDMLVVCLGGGGLLSGCSTIARDVRPGITLVGVEPAAGNDHQLSREAGQRVELDSVPRTIADGQQTTAPGKLTWPINSELVNVFATATDEQIVDTMRKLFVFLKLVAEPSGACALAAVLHGGIVEPGMRVGVTLSGGNIDPTLFAELIRRRKR